MDEQYGIFLLSLIAYGYELSVKVPKLDHNEKNTGSLA